MFREGHQIGLYTLIRRLGRGGFGEVWLAERKSKFVTTKVAVKLPHDEQVNYEAIHLEAQLWEQASGHPNILAIIEAHEYDGQVVIVSEYAPDGSLADKLKALGRLSIKQAVETTIGVLNGLEHLHSKRIIHRDIKPQNILLQGNIPKLADFGISRAMQTTEISSTIIGTEAYMSPESFRGYRTVQTDIWSVGVVLYQLLSGRLPFPQQNPSERMYSILQKEFEPLSKDIPPYLAQIINKALAKLNENRYLSAIKMREDLQLFLTNFFPLQQSISAKPLYFGEIDEIETEIPEKTDVFQSLFKIEMSKIISILLQIIAQKRLEDSLLKNEIGKIISIISRGIARKKIETSQLKNELLRKNEISKIVSIISKVIIQKQLESSLIVFRHQDENERKLDKVFDVDTVDTLINSDNSLAITSQESLEYKMTEYGMRENSKITTEELVRENCEPDTYWNTRVLTHSILGKNYLTPQANLNILVDFLNSVLSEDKKIIRFSFVASTLLNIRFFTLNKEIAFNAHQPINKNNFLKTFDLTNYIQVNSIPNKDKFTEVSKTILTTSYPDTSTIEERNRQRYQEWECKQELLKIAKNGFSTNNPNRRLEESDSFWNVRVLTYALLGEHYRTPPDNVEILTKYLNSQLPDNEKYLALFLMVSPLKN